MNTKYLLTGIAAVLTAVSIVIEILKPGQLLVENFEMDYNFLMIVAFLVLVGYAIKRIS